MWLCDIMGRGRLVDPAQNSILTRTTAIVMVTPIAVITASFSFAVWQHYESRQSVPRLLTDAFNGQQKYLEIGGKSYAVNNRPDGGCTMITAHESTARLGKDGAVITVKPEIARLNGVSLEHRLCTLSVAR